MNFRSIVVSTLSVFAFLAAGQLSAETADWKKIDAKGYFTLSMPSDMEDLEMHGSNSLVGAYQNDKMLVVYDYGRFAPKAKNPTELVDEKQAEVRFLEGDYEFDGVPYKYLAELRFADIGDEENGLVIHVFMLSLEDKATALEILQSTDLKN